MNLAPDDSPCCLPSPLVQTAGRQGVHPRKFLQILLTADPATAQVEVSIAGE